MNFLCFKFIFSVILSIEGVKSAVIYAMQASNMRNLQRAEMTGTTKTTISDDFLKDMMIIGYFYQSACSSSDNTPLITIRNAAEEYILMNLSTNSCTKLNVKGIVDSSNIVREWTPITTTTQLNTWKLFGIGFKNSTNRLLLQNGASYTVDGLAIALPIKGASLEICIACVIPGDNYAAFNGKYSTIKLLTGYAVQSTSSSFYPQYFISPKANMNSYMLTDDVKSYITANFPTAVFTCPAGYAYFDGICFLLENCTGLIQDIIDDIGATNNSFYSNSTSCMICSDNCKTCLSTGACSVCDDGFMLSGGSCMQCSAGSYFDSSTQSCVSNCPSGYYKDLANLKCVQAFELENHIVGPFLNKRVFNQNQGFQIIDTSTSVPASDSYDYCFLNYNAISGYTIYGGAQLTSSQAIVRDISAMPASGKKIIQFTAVFFVGTYLDLTLSVNQNVIQPRSYVPYTGSNLICGTTDIIKAYFLTYEVLDDLSDFSIKLTSASNKWGIRGFNLTVVKCHPTCKSCYSDRLASSCWQCSQESERILSKCYCPKGQYIQHLPTCYSSPCYLCSYCPNKCSTCENLTGKCTTCNSGYYLQQGTCISVCGTQYSISSQSCLRSTTTGLKHLFDNKIAQYFEYWNIDGGARMYQCQEYYVEVYLSRYAYLKIDLPNYKGYIYGLNLSLIISNKDSPDTNEYLTISDSSLIIGQIQGYSNAAGSVNLCGKEHKELKIYRSYSYEKKTKALFLKIQSNLTDTEADEGFLFKDVQIAYCKHNKL